ncbi:MAG: hypothetical protein JXX14_10125 [Deltaproteobacteria bacterium]|nr:hypothetical protein [Deltaproteobacteria bacterium]
MVRKILSKMTGWVLLVCLFPLAAHATESYPDFNRDYWVTQQDLAKGKMQRGAGLGVLGIVAIWPTTVMIAKAKDNPHRYIALSGVFGAAAIGAMLHGFGSVGFGKKQKDRATSFIEQYDRADAGVSLESQQTSYLRDTRKSTLKVMRFGVYLTGIAAILLSNAVVQSVRRHNGKDMDGIRIWPYYLAGSLLAAAGVGITIRSKKKGDDLNALENSSLPVAGGNGIFPFYVTTPDGGAAFGMSLSSSF